MLFVLSSFSQINQDPMPKMGNKMLKEFLLVHQIYPEKAIKNDNEGIVEIKFTTDAKGKVLEKEIISPVSPELDKEALRLFNLIIWEPSLKYGIKSPGNNTLDINFKIKKYKKFVKQRGFKQITVDYPIDSSLIIYNQKKLDSVAKPNLPNGKNSLYNYVYSLMEYPAPAVKLEIEGKVEICFIIETNGLPSNFIVKKSLGGGCTAEALRLIKDIKWKPGYKNGMAVRSQRTIFIEFKLSNIQSGKNVTNQNNSGF
jgi:protein TonB